ncbi:hypothetical protein BSG1_11331 [Bacillus sp. SG-1]|nr:hypothetical protein BSG1_11331 [Bacillus sp. SG-1]
MEEKSYPLCSEGIPCTQRKNPALGIFPKATICAEIAFQKEENYTSVPGATRIVSIGRAGRCCLVSKIKYVRHNSQALSPVPAAKQLPINKKRLRTCAEPP